MNNELERIGKEIKKAIAILGSMRPVFFPKNLDFITYAKFGSFKESPDKPTFTPPPAKPGIIIKEKQFFPDCKKEGVSIASERFLSAINNMEDLIVDMKKIIESYHGDGIENGCRMLEEFILLERFDSVYPVFENEKINLVESGVLN